MKSDSVWKPAILVAVELIRVSRSSSDPRIFYIRGVGNSCICTRIIQFYCSRARYFVVFPVSAQRSDGIRSRRVQRPPRVARLARELEVMIFFPSLTRWITWQRPSESNYCGLFNETMTICKDFNVINNVA